VTTELKFAMNAEPNTPTPLTDAHAATFTVDNPGWRNFSRLLERKLRAMTVRAEKAELLYASEAQAKRERGELVVEAQARAEKAEADLAFERARNTRLFTQRDEAVEAQEKAEAEVARLKRIVEQVLVESESEVAAERLAGNPVKMREASIRRAALAAIDAAMKGQP
jgi:hypothetical protein